MKKQIIGILLCIVLIGAAVFPVVGLSNVEKNFFVVNEILSNDQNKPKPKVTDPDTRFHRIYILGWAKCLEKKAQNEDYEAMKKDLESDKNQKPIVSE